MGLFDDILKHGESLFVDEVSLDFDFLPRKLPHRENQHQYVAECIKPLFNKWVKNVNFKAVCSFGVVSINTLTAYSLTNFESINTNILLFIQNLNLFLY